MSAKTMSRPRLPNFRRPPHFDRIGDALLGSNAHLRHEIGIFANEFLRSAVARVAYQVKHRTQDDRCGCHLIDAPSHNLSDTPSMTRRPSVKALTAS
jgi:hypothetical protein